MKGFYILLTLILSSYIAVDGSGLSMWKIFEEQNKISAGVQHDPSVFIKEGDIYTNILNEEAKLNLTQSAPSSKAMVMFTWHLRLWPRKIPFQISSFYSQNDKTTIRKSLKLISDVTCLTFHDYRSSDTHWIEFYKGKGCFSGIGRHYYRDNAATRISLGNNCVNSPIVVHEVLHALGFFHEQSRFDRDSFVKLYPHNILKGYQDQYEKNRYLEEYYAGTVYDYESIMHYSNKAFVNNYEKNTMENKFDPLYELGTEVLSKTDIQELNARYQCNVKSGWSNWTPMSRCIANYLGECTKASVRFCVSENRGLCPGADKYGTQSNVIVCEKSECDATEKFQDGFWGRWGAYDKCSGTCGWGVQTRRRKCDNPIPSYGGKECSGISVMKHLCRKTRCGGATQNDLNFENGLGKWSSDGFIRQRGKVANGIGGPNADHTSEVENVQGWYGMAFHRKPKIATLKSPLIISYQGKKCISFYYQLNGGRKLNEKDALSVYIEYKDGSTVNLPFVKGGHQGNFWKRAALNVNGITQPFRVVFRASFSWVKSIVAVDDIFFDHSPCGKGLEDCNDVDNKCDQYATKDFCIKNFRIALQECCFTCSAHLDETSKSKVTTQTPKVTPTEESSTTTPTKYPFKNCNQDMAKHSKNCVIWTRKGYCTSKDFVEFMQKHCCKSCATVERQTTTTKATTLTKIQTTLIPRTTSTTSTAKKCIEIPYYKDKCPIWAKRNLCHSRITFWKNLMSTYCCRECGKVGPKKPVKKCVEVAEYKDKCPIWAKRGYCTSKLKFWKDLMTNYCCEACKDLSSTSDTGKSKSKCVEIAEYKDKCPIWAKRGYCKTSVKFWKDLMTNYCCKACEK